MASAFEARRLDDPGLQRYIEARLGRAAPPPGRWDAPTLTLAAYYFSPELDRARARVAVRRAEVRTAAQRPNPTLLLPLGYTVHGAGGRSPYLAGLGLDIPIETAGKRDDRVEQAERLGDAARLQLGVAAWRLRGELHAALLDLEGARRRQAILARQRAAQERVARLLAQRLAAGDASAVEAHVAQVALARTGVESARARAAASAAQARAAALIGLPPQALQGVEIRLDAIDRPVPVLPLAQARREAVLERADLRVALAQYAASQAALQLAVARQFPDLHLGPGYTFDTGADKLSLTVSGIELPLFNQHQGQIAEARARRAEAGAQVLAVQARALGEVDAAVAGLADADLTLQHADALWAAQRATLGDERRAFDAGQVGRLALARLQAAVAGDEFARLDAQLERQRAVARLEQALQRPLDPDEPPAMDLASRR